MAHFPRPSAGMRTTLALILSLGYAAAVTMLLVFRAGACPVPLPGPLALLWIGFAALELPATFAGPGNRSRRFKRAAFVLLAASFAIALIWGPTPDCAAGRSATRAAVIVAGLGVVSSAVLLVLGRRPGEPAHLTRLGPGERKSDTVRRGN